MQYKVTGIRIKEMPSRYGGTWKLATVKVDGKGEEKFELQGYGTKFVEGIKEGTLLKGYEGSKEYNGTVTKTINKITAEYVYDILMDMKGTPEVKVPAAAPAQESADDDW